MNMEVIKKIENEAKEFFVGASGCHDWTHVERVRSLALRIGQEEKADLSVVEIAALLHDIGRKEEMQARGEFCHAEAGAEIAAEILKKHNLDKAIAENIIHSIITHRFRNSYVPETIEAKVLFDADKLDSIGAVGVGRDFLFAGSAGSNCLYTGNERKIAKSAKSFSFTEEDSPILEYEIKLKKIKDKMLTETGKRLARARHDFMEEFFRRFWSEVKGDI